MSNVGIGTNSPSEQLDIQGMVFTLNTKPSWLKLCWWWLKRIVTQRGPHGKKCNCPKWGWYMGLGCPNPADTLYIDPDGAGNVGIGA